jgi:hypothetical protein
MRAERPAHHGHHRHLRADADVSVTVRLTRTVKTAIASIDDGAWTPIEYTDAVYDEAADVWISRAEVAEIPFTAFASEHKAHQIPGRLVVRRIPDLRPKKAQDQGALFDIWRFHAFTPPPAPTISTPSPPTNFTVIMRSSSRCTRT